MTADNTYTAYVQKVLAKGKHGPYAVAREETIGLITFALDRDVWHEETWPEQGSCVMLSDVQKKRAGWRALKGRFFRPEDERKSKV